MLISHASKITIWNCPEDNKKKKFRFEVPIRDVDLEGINMTMMWKYNDVNPLGNKNIKSEM